jgi:hypothetical protein
VWRVGRPSRTTTISSSRRSSGGIPSGVPTTVRLGTPSSSIGVRVRLTCTWKLARLLQTSTRPAVGCRGAPGLSRASWPTSRLAITPACATLTPSPRMLTCQGSSREDRMTTAAMTATTTTTVTSITGLGRSMTKSLQHFQNMFDRLWLNLAMYFNSSSIIYVILIM